MSDSSQILVDVDADAGRTDELALEVRRWLIAEGIIEAERQGGGHSPGPRRQEAIQGEPPSTAWCLDLGVEFWNWPPLSEPFIRRLARHLGHTLVLVRRRV